MTLKWLPNTLTLARCLLAVFVGLVIYSGAKSASASVWPLIFFTLIALTDFLDGFAARKLNAVSPLGAFLDPVADKLLVGASLLALSAASGWSLLLTIPTVIIVTRDVFVTVLRLFPRIELPVSQLAKWKTALEMLGIGSILLGAVFGRTWLGDGVAALALTLTWLAAALSAYTMGLYVGSLMPEPKRPR